MKIYTIPIFVFLAFQAFGQKELYCQDTLKLPCIVSRSMSFTYMAKDGDKMTEQTVRSTEREIFEARLTVIQKHYCEENKGWTTEREYRKEDGEPLPDDWRVFIVGTVK